MPAPKVLYLVYQDGEDEQYFNQYESLEDAVSAEGDGCLVSEAKPKVLGFYRRSVRVIKERIKKPKKLAKISKSDKAS